MRMTASSPLMSMQRPFNYSNTIILAIFVTISALFSKCHAFSLHIPTFSKQRGTATIRLEPLHALADDEHNMNPDSPIGRNMKRTCIRHFLTQRAVQSFMFLCEECRDPHTADWVESVANLTNFLEYHGTGAFNLERFPHWHTFLLDLTECPEETIIIKARGPGRPFGGSKNNPYVQAQDAYVEYEVKIDPTSLASRIMSTREQIAKEWMEDLDLVVESNNQVLSSYFDNVRDERDVGGGVEAEGKLDQSLERQQRKTFERIPVDVLMDINIHFDFINGGFKHSPLRKASLDLLLLLSMQESVHRVLRKFKDMGEKKEVSFEWLRDFYIERVAKLFDGCVRYGNADEFLDQMLLTPPSMKHTFDGNVGLVDPLGIAEEIIRTRNEVAVEWKEVMTSVPAEHVLIRKSLLSKQMENWETPTESMGNIVQTDGIFE